MLAAALAAAGAEVHVWAPAAAGPAAADAGVTVHGIAGRWSPADLARLGAALDAFPAPRRLLVQYVPNAWGYKGLNLGFGRWLVGAAPAGRRRPGDVPRGPLLHAPPRPADPLAPRRRPAPDGPDAA